MCLLSGRPSQYHRTESRAHPRDLKLQLASQYPAKKSSRAKPRSSDIPASHCFAIESPPPFSYKKEADPKTKCQGAQRPSVSPR